MKMKENKEKVSRQFIPTGNTPFVGSMKDQPGSVLMNPSIRAIKRGALNRSRKLQMKKQFIQYIQVVGGTFNNIGIRVGGGKHIITGGKVVYHDPSARV